MDRTDSSLSHYGVNGMKWGVRRKQPSGPVEVTTITRPGERVKAKGGKNLGPSEDAVKKARLHQTARKSTTDSLSNKELRDLVERMNLEVQYQRLDQQTMTGGRKLVNDALKKFEKNPKAAVDEFNAYTKLVKDSYEKNLKK